MTPVPGLAASTATGIARRFTPEHWRGARGRAGRATARMLGLLPAERAAELAGGPVTIDIDATDVEVSADVPVMPRAARLCCSVS